MISLSDMSRIVFNDNNSRFCSCRFSINHWRQCMPPTTPISTISKKGHTVHALSRLSISCLTLFTCLTLLGQTASAEVTVIGSSTLSPFLKEWTQLMKAKTGADVSISTPGTSVAPKALVQGKADLGAMNREMTNDEAEAFIRAYGYYPTAIAVAIEAVAVYAHPENPITGLDYAQLDALYSSGRGCGWREDINSWGQAGVSGAWGKQPIVLLGHDKKSAIRDFFNKSVICRGDFKAGIEELSPEALLAKIAENKYALGYGSYVEDSKLRVVPIKKGEGDFVPLTKDNVYNRSYRLQHYLYLYVNKPKNKPLSPEVQDFLKIGLSSQGQEAVKDAGYLPLSPDLIQRQLSKLR